MIIKAFDSIDTNIERAVALGSFDGVHTAHAEVINSAVDFAKKSGCAASVVTFRQNPSAALGKACSIITPNPLKEEYIDALKVDELIYIDFDESFMKLSPIEFFGILKNRMNAVSVSCGYNYRFGNSGKGNSELLGKLCNDSGINFACLSPITQNDVAISSTRIRSLIENGDIADANALLGHPFEVCENVINGQKLGRCLQFPTANQPLPENSVVPRFGVYVTRTLIDGITYHSVTNIGNRPTVGGQETISETNIFDYNGDIYGKRIRVEFLNFLRDERKFSSVGELKKQIENDCVLAKNYFEKFE